MGDQLEQAAAEPAVFLYEGEELAYELKCQLTRVHVGPQVTEIPYAEFCYCEKMIALQLNEGLEVIGEEAFEGCTSLRSVTIPSTITKWGEMAFFGCISLIELQLKEGMKVIGARAFHFCKALRRTSTTRL